MECPVCGYDAMDTYADGERVIYSCPSCDKDDEHGFVVLKKEITVLNIHRNGVYMEIRDTWLGGVYWLSFDYDSLIDEDTFDLFVREKIFAIRNRRLYEDVEDK